MLDKIFLIDSWWLVVLPSLFYGHFFSAPEIISLYIKAFLLVRIYMFRKQIMLIYIFPITFKKKTLVKRILAFFLPFLNLIFLFLSAALLKEGWNSWKTPSIQLVFFYNKTFTHKRKKIATIIRCITNCYTWKN